MAGGRFELAMEPTAIGSVSLNSNLETHMTVICDSRLIYGTGWIARVFICCATLNLKDVAVQHPSTGERERGPMVDYKRDQSGSPTRVPLTFVSYRLGLTFHTFLSPVSVTGG